MDFAYTPIRIGDFDNVKQISCYEYSTAFVTKTGECYVCGNNMNGELGIGYPNVIDRPVKIQLDNVDQVSCGDSVLVKLFQDKNGTSIYRSTGWRYYPTDPTYDPIYLENVIQIFAGRVFAFIIKYD